MTFATRCLTTTLAAAGLSATLAAQLSVQPVTEPVKSFKLNYATGELTQLSNSTHATVPAAFDNASCFAGFFATQGAGDEWMDFGVKATGLSGFISEFSFGYGTTAADPSIGGPGATIGINVYAGTTGMCAATDPGTLVGSFAFTGLPGATAGGAVAISISVDISAAAICVPDGPLGWSYVELGDAAVTGPLLMSVGACPSGAIDGFDLYNPTPATAATCTGTFVFGSPGIASFFFSMSEDDGATPASATFRNTTNPPDYLVTSPPVIGGSLDATITLAPPSLPISILVLAVAPAPPIINPAGFGELLISVSPFPFFDIAGGTHSLPVPKDTSLIGAAIFSQGFRGGTALLGADIFDALNAFDLVIGT